MTRFNFRSNSLRKPSRIQFSNQFTLRNLTISGWKPIYPKNRRCSTLKSTYLRAYSKSQLPERRNWKILSADWCETSRLENLEQLAPIIIFNNNKTISVKYSKQK